MEITEEELIEIEQDMNSNNGTWVSNENVKKLIAEIRKLKKLIKPCQSNRNCKKNDI